MFCLKYFELGNATEAAIQAGYTPTSAAVIACNHLKKDKILARLDQLRAEVKSKAIMSVQERQERLTEIARARLTDFMELGQDGSWVNLGPDVPMSAAIQEIRSRTEYDKDGSKPTVHTAVKLHSPLQAIDLLNKMDKIYSEAAANSFIQNNVNRTVNIIVANDRTKELIERAGERTKLLADGLPTPNVTNGKDD
jgi:phage terminase small subunit